MTKDLKLFFDNFDKLAESPGGVQKLRELFLQLAVQGKLVPQDPNDEVASELLKKIKAEKEKLIKDGKLKKQKPLPSIEPDEIPYKLPTGWKWVRLGDLLTFEYGKGLDKNRRVIEGKFPVHGANGIMCYCNEPLIEGKSIIIGRKGSAGAVNISDTSCWPTDVTYYIQPSSNLHFIFIFHLLKSLHLEYMAKGIKPGLNRNEAYELVVALPPLAEQKRIVAKVDELMALCDQLEEKQQKASHSKVVLNNSAINHLLVAETQKEFNKHWQLICNNFDLLYNDPQSVNKLRQAILQLAVQSKLVPQDPKDEPASVLLERIKAEKEKLVKAGKIKKQKPLPPIDPDEIPYELPKSWEWIRLAQGGFTQTGTTPSRSNPQFFGNDYPFVKPADIFDNYVNYDNEGLSELGIENGRLIRTGSALMVCIGGSIGKVGYVTRDCSCNQQINAVTPCCEMEAIFFAYWMRSPYFQGEVLSRAPQTTLPILSKGKWDLILFPLPPLAEQKRIVKKVDALMALCDELEEKIKQSREKSEKLMAATIHHLLVA